MHSGWNYILFNILGLNLSGNDELTAAVFDMRSAGENILNGGKYGIEASAITAIVLAVFLIICYTISRKAEATEQVVKSEFYSDIKEHVLTDDNMQKAKKGLNAPSGKM